MDEILHPKKIKIKLRPVKAKKSERGRADAQLHGQKLYHVPPKRSSQIRARIDSLVNQFDPSAEWMFSPLKNRRIIQIISLVHDYDRDNL